jgi:hypothetical protein
MPAGGFHLPPVAEAPHHVAGQPAAQKRHGQPVVPRRARDQGEGHVEDQRDQRPLGDAVVPQRRRADDEAHRQPMAEDGKKVPEPHSALGDHGHYLEEPEDEAHVEPDGRRPAPDAGLFSLRHRCDYPPAAVPPSRRRDGRAQRPTLYPHYVIIAQVNTRHEKS